MFSSLGEYGMAKEHLEKAVAVRKELCDKDGEAEAYFHLGTVFHCQGEYSEAAKY